MFLRAFGSLWPISTLYEGLDSLDSFIKVDCGRFGSLGRLCGPPGTRWLVTPRPLYD